MTERRPIVPEPRDLEVPKVAVTGAPCSGKSTAISEVAGSLGDRVSYAEEQARILFADIPYIPDRLGFSIQCELADMICREERRAAETGQPVVADRTIVDGSVFIRWGGDPEVAEQVFEYVRRWMETYDHLLLCSPNGIPYESDDVRVETSEQRDAIHQAFIEAFEHWGIRYDVLDGDRAERHTHISRLVQDLA